jgi:5-methylthioadenosine/S-adenosylhomocysteine deaminase
MMVAEKKHADIIIKGGAVVTMDDDLTIIEDGAIAIQGMEIAAIGIQSEIEAIYNGTQVIDADGQVVVPGLVNTHSHLAMTILRGIADDMKLEPWLEKIWKVEGEFATPENCRLGTQLALIEHIKGGATTTTDMYWHIEVTNDVAIEMGFRLVNGPIFIDFVGPDGVDPAQREKVARDFFETYEENPLVHPSVLAHSTYTVPDHLLRLCGELAQEFGAIFITHASESKGELEIVQKRYGKTAIEHLDALGLLTPHTLLAHCVHLRDDEIALLAERHTKVAHCPESNLKLGSGIARVPDMLRAGVTVGLGTDGAASNNDLNMWGEMRTAALIQKGISFNPTSLPASQAFRMATIEGAKALGLDHLIGSLEVGKRADIAIVDFQRTHLIPFYDYYSHLVYAVDRSDVRDVIINGQVVMRDRELTTIDDIAVLDQAREIREKIMQI